MAKRSNSFYGGHIRSISLPSRSHPSMISIEVELNKLKTWEASPKPTAESICKGLSGLGQVFQHMDELVNSKLTRQALALHRQDRWVSEYLDLSVWLLDFCGITRDMMSQVKECGQELQSSLRRRKGDSSIEESISKYFSLTKKMKRDAKKLIAELKLIDDKFNASLLLELDHHLLSVVRVLREVGSITVSVYHSLLVYLSSSNSKPKSTRWFLVSNLLNKRRVACEGQRRNTNELEEVEAALNTICRVGSNDWGIIQTAQSSLKNLEANIELAENLLESLFRRLIKARTSFLNIV